MRVAFFCFAERVFARDAVVNLLVQTHRRIVRKDFGFFQAEPPRLYLILCFHAHLRRLADRMRKTKTQIIIIIRRARTKTNNGTYHMPSNEFVFVVHCFDVDREAMRIATRRNHLGQVRRRQLFRQKLNKRLTNARTQRQAKASKRRSRHKKINTHEHTHIYIQVCCAQGRSCRLTSFQFSSSSSKNDCDFDNARSRAILPPSSCVIVGLCELPKFYKYKNRAFINKTIKISKRVKHSKRF